MSKFSINQMVITFVLFLLLPISSLFAKKEKFSSKFYRPMIAYLGLDGPALQQLRNDELNTIETSFRKEIEQKRFIFLNTKVGLRGMDQLVKTLVEMIKAKSQGVAKMRSVWNSQYQEYPVTEELLESVHNASFMYFLELFEARHADFLIPFTNSRLFRYAMKVKLHLYQFVIFSCVASNRKKSIEHAKACFGKTESDFVGFAKIYKTLKVESGGVPVTSRSLAFTAGVSSMGSMLAKTMFGLKEFKLHAPIEHKRMEHFKIPLGKSEGVKINQGYDIFVRHVSGKLMPRGYAKIVSVGDNEMKIENGRRVRKNPNAPFFSSAQIVHGDNIMKGMMAYEHPMTLWSLSVYPQVYMPLLPLLSGSLFITGGLRLDVDYDLSHSIGSSNTTLNFGADLLYMPLGLFYSMPLLLHVGIMKKIFIRRFFLSFGAKALFGYTFFEEAYIAAIEGILGFEFFITPAVTFGLRLGFRAGIPNHQIGPWGALGLQYTF